MNVFERYLTIWVALCIVIGIGLGQLFPTVFQFVGRVEVAHINLPVAVLVWLMIIPMLIKIDFKQLKGVRQHWRGVGVTLFVNWFVLMPGLIQCRFGQRRRQRPVRQYRGLIPSAGQRCVHP